MHALDTVWRETNQAKLLHIFSSKVLEALALLAINRPI